MTGREGHEFISNGEGQKKQEINNGKKEKDMK